MFPYNLTEHYPFTAITVHHFPCLRSMLLIKLHVIFNVTKCWINNKIFWYNITKTNELYALSVICVITVVLHESCTWCNWNWRPHNVSFDIISMFTTQRLKVRYVSKLFRGYYWQLIHLSTVIVGVFCRKFKALQKSPLFRATLICTIIEFQSLVDVMFFYDVWYRRLSKLFMYIILTWNNK